MACIQGVDMHRCAGSARGSAEVALRGTWAAAPLPIVHLCSESPPDAVMPSVPFQSAAHQALGQLAYNAVLTVLLEGRDCCFGLLLVVA